MSNLEVLFHSSLVNLSIMYSLGYILATQIVESVRKLLKP
jgi:hypothetical protein